MEKLYTANKNRPGTDCGSDHELLITKFRLKLKKVGETSRPFRYDLNQIPYDYTVEVRNRLKGLDLIDRVPNELWNEAGQRLIEFSQENTMVIANTLFKQHQRILYIWTSPDGQQRSQIDYIIFSQRWRSSI